MTYNHDDWQKAVVFHGHSCPGLAQGFRASQLAMRVLKIERAEDEELVAIVECDACGVDAVQSLTGCTLGKGNLIFHDYGKPVYTFVRRNPQKAVRVYVHGGLQPKNPDFLKLRSKVEANIATPTEADQYRHILQENVVKLLTQPEKEILEWHIADIEVPEKARLFNSIQCSICGEKTCEGSARVKDGKPVCLPCAVKYTRGW